MKEIKCSFGIDIDSVAGWIGSYGGQDSPSDIQRGVFATEVGVPRLLRLFEKYDMKLINRAIPYDQRGSSFSKATLNSLSPLLSELRLIKSAEELENLKRACDITVEGHKSAMEFTKKDMYEYQIEAEMEKTFYDLGAERLGYPSIVASGDNACILHYSTNREKVENNGLI